jgi:hypothetical protein
MRVFVLDFPVQPVFAEQFAGMGCSNRSISAAERVRGTILVAAPAYAFRLLGMKRNLCHIVLLAKS